MASGGSVGSINVSVKTLYDGRRFKSAITDFKSLKKSVYDADKSLVVFQTALGNTTKSVSVLSGAVEVATANILELSGVLQKTALSAKNTKNSFTTSASTIGYTGVAASQTQASVQKMGNEFKRSPTVLNPFNKTLVETNTSLVNTADKSKKAANSIGNLRQSMAMAGKSISMTGKSITYGTLPMAGLGLISTNMAVEFEKNMNRMVSLANISMKDMQKMKDPILSLASAYGIAGEEAADAAYFIASSGFKASQTLDVLETSLMASKVGMGDVKSVADLLTSAINAYGKKNLSAAKAGNIMQAAIAAGKFEADEMAEVMGSVIPIASELDISFADTAATLAIMSKTGTDAYKGATQLRGIMTALLKPSVQGAEALAKVGLSVGMVRDKIQKDGLYAGLLMLKNGLDGNKEAMAKVFPNVRGLAGFLNVMGKQAKYSGDIFRDVNKDADQLGKAFNQIKNTPAEQFSSAINDFRIQMIRLGIVIIPIFTKIVKKVNELFRKLNNLSKSQKELIVKVGILAASFGPLLVVLGAVIQSFSVLIGLLKPLGMLFAGGGAGIARFAGPVGIALGVIMALIAGITALTKNSDEAKAKFSQWGQQILTALSGLWETLKPIFNGIKNAFFEVFGGSNKQQIIQDLNSIIDAVVWVINAITWFFKTFGKDIIQIFKGAFQIIGGILRVVGSLIRGDWKGVWSGLVEIVKGAVNVFVSVIKIGFKIISSIVHAIAWVIKWPFIQIGKLIGKVIDSGINKLEELINKIKKAISKIKEFAEKIDLSLTKPWTFSPAYQIGKEGKEIFGGKASGGIANPGNFAIVGDSAKPEFVISQTGPKNKNIQLLGMAANALGVPMFADGGMTKRDRFKASMMENKRRQERARKESERREKAKRDKFQESLKENKRKFNKNKKNKGDAIGGKIGGGKIGGGQIVDQSKIDKAKEKLSNQTMNLEEKYSYYERKFRSDNILTSSELGRLLSIKDEIIGSVKQERSKVKPGSSDWKSFSMTIKNHELDKKELIKQWREEKRSRKEERRQKIQERKDKRKQAIEDQFSYLGDRYSYLERKYRMDDKLTQQELDHLLKIKNQQIKNIRKQQRLTKKGSLKWKSFETQIQELILDKQQLQKEFLDQKSGANMAQQIIDFNAEKFAVVSSFGGNIRARSQIPFASMSRPSQSIPTQNQQTTQTTNQAGKNITINQQFKERPTDPHVWTRDIQNEISALI